MNRQIGGKWFGSAELCAFQHYSAALDTTGVRMASTRNNERPQRSAENTRLCAARAANAEAAFRRAQEGTMPERIPPRVANKTKAVIPTTPPFVLHHWAPRRIIPPTLFKRMYLKARPLLVAAMYVVS
jgi:hypothetical protein